MNLIYSFSSSLFLLVVVITIKFSGNDKAPFLIILPIVYSLVSSAFHLSRIIKGIRESSAAAMEKYLYLCFFISLLPILYIGLIVILARKGLLDASMFLGFK